MIMSLVDPWFEQIQYFQVAVDRVLGVLELCPRGFVFELRVRGDLREDEVSMSEEKEISGLIVAFANVYVCLHGK